VNVDDDADDDADDNDTGDHVSAGETMGDSPSQDDPEAGLTPIHLAVDDQDRTEGQGQGEAEDKTPYSSDRSYFPTPGGSNPRVYEVEQT